MQAIVKSSIKIVARHPQGILLSVLVDQLNGLDIVKVDKAMLLASLTKVPQLLLNVDSCSSGRPSPPSLDTSSSLPAAPDNIDPLIRANSTLQHHYQKKGVFDEMGQESNTREILRSIYETIVSFQEEGTNYQQIRTIYNKAQPKESLEITMISHYCRRLYEMHLIKILSDLNQKKVVARIFLPRKQHFDITQIKKKYRHNRNIVSPLVCSPTETEQEKWQQFKKDKFVFRELNFDENMKLNLLSAQAVQQQGLYMDQIFRRMNKSHEKKMIQKIILQYQQQFNQERQGRLHYTDSTFSFQTNAIRRGKTYSLKYYFSNAHFQERLNQERVPTDSPEKEELNVERPVLPFAPQLAPLDHGCFLFIRQFLLGDPCLLTRFEQQIENQMQKFKGIPSEKQFCQQMVQFKDRNIDYIPQGSLYEQATLAMLKVVFEEWEQKESRLETNWRFSKRQVSLQKIQRYIMIMNQVVDERVTPMFRIKKRIITSEKADGEVFTGKIDRKTLQIMINALEEVGLIKQCFRKMSIYQDTLNPQQSRNNMVLWHSVEQDDPLIKQVVDKYVSVRDIKEEFQTKHITGMTLRKKVKRETAYQDRDQLQSAYQQAVQNKDQGQIKQVLRQSRVSSILMKVQVFASHFQQLEYKVNNRIKREFIAKIKLYYNGYQLVQDIDGLQLSSVYLSSFHLFQQDGPVVVPQARPLLFKDTPQIEWEIDQAMEQQALFNHDGPAPALTKFTPQEKNMLRLTQLYHLQDESELSKTNLRFQQAMNKLVLCILRYPRGLLGHLKLKINNEFSVDNKSISYAQIMAILQRIGLIQCYKDGQCFQQWHDLDYSYSSLKDIVYSLDPSFLDAQ